MTAPSTPMMRQYQAIKAEHTDSVLFFRLGDFYEMFNEDAIEVSRLLNLTLTERTGCPMCGIPYHASKIYIARLLRSGKKIAICEQVSDPVPGGLTERKVVEVITPGTAVGDDFLEQGQNNYLAAVYASPKKIQRDGVSDFFIGFSYIDVSTGEFFALSFPKSVFIEQLRKELGRIRPKELLIQQSLLGDCPDVHRLFEEYPAMLQNVYPDWSYNPVTAEKRLCTCFGTESLHSFGLSVDSPEVPPAGLLLDYLERTAGNTAGHITGIKIYRERDFVVLDDATRKNLELVQNLRDGTGAYTLFETLCYTKTAMGTRLLRYWIDNPLRHREDIAARLEKTVVLYREEKMCAQVRTLLAEVMDLHRLAGKIAMRRAHGKDLLGIRQSLGACLELYALSKKNNLFFLQMDDVSYDGLESLYRLLSDSIADDCPVALSDGGLIKAGWSEKLDRLRNIQDNANQLLDEYLQKERAATGIQNLKLKYNRLLGYFLEVSKGNLSAVPEHFISRRALSNAERFTTESLVELEAQLNDAVETILACERELFDEVYAHVYENVELLRLLAHELAELDVFQSFVHAAVIYGWVKPEFSDDGGLNICEGRHPVVERHLPSGEFVPNSLQLSSQCVSGDISSFALITGPNMAGKSTYLRQTALIVLLAQIGSFVPAEKVVLTPVDRIFCRVGATDNLARGESTFLVEMTETSYILRNASRDSLVIMDEVGRGTATADGLAIAQAVSEYLLDEIGAKTLFATHYHELIQLAHPKLKNLCLDVRETEGQILFLKKVIEGSAPHSYGIHVGKIAGLPASVVMRAKEINEVLACTEKPVTPVIPKKEKQVERLFSEEELIINEILSCHPDALTPLEALTLIAGWKKALSGL